VLHHVVFYYDMYSKCFPPARTQTVNVGVTSPQYTFNKARPRAAQSLLMRYFSL